MWRLKACMEMKYVKYHRSLSLVVTVTAVTEDIVPSAEQKMSPHIL